MSAQAWFVAALTAVTLILLIQGRVRPDAIGLLLMVALVAAGVLTYREAVEGLGNKAILTIAGLYVVGEGLSRTGALEFVARGVLSASAGRPRRTIAAVCVVAALASSFLNDTAVVLVLVPVAIDLSRSLGVPLAHLLMPISFASLLGGMNTLIGTSTNLLVSGVAEERGLAPIGMFEMTPLAVVLCGLGIVYMALLAPRLLRGRGSIASGPAGAREYLTEVRIGPASPLLGSAYADVARRVRARLALVVRGEAMLAPPFEGAVQPGDALLLRGSVDEIAALEGELGLRHAAGPAERGMAFFELALAPHSPLVGRPIEELRLWRDFGAVPVAIQRAAQHVRGSLGGVHLRAGDLLLVLGDEGAEARLRASSDFYVVGGAEGQVRLRSRARRALWVTGLVVALFVLTSVGIVPWVPQPFVAVLGAMGMIATGCVTPRRVYRTIDWPILIFIAGTIALGDALHASGAAGVLAGGIVDLLLPHGPGAILSGLMLLCILLNTLVGHSAAVLLLTPIAVGTAELLSGGGALAGWGGHPAEFLRACVLAVAFGGSVCFATPFGHQVNLIVMGPGGYRYRDYLRLGVPLSILAWIVVSLALPRLVGLPG